MLDVSPTYNGIDVCPRCGWTVISVDKATHTEACRIDAGASGTKLAGSLPAIASTKLGHGGGNLTFNFDDHTSITLRCLPGDRFSFESMFLLDLMDANAARDLVTILAAWRKRRG